MFFFDYSLYCFFNTCRHLPKKANRIYLTLQGVFKETMKVKGCNRFKISHMAKGTLEKQGRLPLQLTCETSLLADSIATLAASSNNNETL
jgi:hypothetical protein